jgi:mRNA interferase MazF
VVTVAQGDVWWAEAVDKRRPVLIVTRSEAIPVLSTIVVAPVTRTIRRISTEVDLGPGEGLPEECVASFDNLQPIPKRLLTTRIGALAERRHEICRAIGAMADC